MITILNFRNARGLCNKSAPTQKWVEPLTMFYFLVNLIVPFLLHCFIFWSTPSYGFELDLREGDKTQGTNAQFVKTSSPLTNSNEVLLDEIQQADLKRSDLKLRFFSPSGKSFQFQQHSLRFSAQNESYFYSGSDLDSQSTVFLNQNEEAISIFIYSSENNYWIYSNGEDWTLQERSNLSFPDEIPPLTVPLDLQREEPSSSFLTLDDEDNVIIKVLFLYSPSAFSLFNFDTEEALSFAKQNITLSNNIFERSRVKIRLELAHVEELGTFSEATSNNEVENDLLILKEDSAVQELKELYNAEIVALIGDYDGQLCGIANVITTFNPNSFSNAYSIVDKECAILNLSFPHEIGHNMGLRHDKFVESDLGAFRYSHGYVNTQKNWRTILAYNDECTKQGSNCQRIPYFSSASLEYLGDCLGNQTANNQKSLNNIRFLLSDSSDEVQSAEGDSGNTCSSSTSDDESNPSKGCFLSSIAYGSPIYEDLNKLRMFRDQQLKGNFIGEYITEFYYSKFSPTLKPYLKYQLFQQSSFLLLSGIILLFELDPMVWIISILTFIYFIYSRRKFFNK